MTGDGNGYATPRGWGRNRADLADLGDATRWVVVGMAGTSVPCVALVFPGADAASFAYDRALDQVTLSVRVDSDYTIAEGDTWAAVLDAARELLTTALGERPANAPADGFRLRAEFIEGGAVVWDSRVEVAGEDWINGAVIAATIAGMGNRIADALADRNRGER